MIFLRCLGSHAFSMTASNSVVNGSDLDECCSNVFALVSLPSARVLWGFYSMSHVTEFRTLVTLRKCIRIFILLNSNNQCAS